jgi:hypothetical protein
MESLKRPVPYFAILGTAIFAPTQGFMNFTVYVRPRYLRYRQQHSWWRSFWAIREKLPTRNKAGSTLPEKQHVEAQQQQDTEMETAVETAAVEELSWGDSEIVAEEDADVMDPSYALLMNLETCKDYLVDGDEEEESAGDEPVDRRNLWYRMKGVVAKVECRVSHILSQRSLINSRSSQQEGGVDRESKAGDGPDLMEDPSSRCSEVPEEIWEEFEAAGDEITIISYANTEEF